MIDAKYISESGRTYELREDGWYREGKKFSRAVFLSREGGSIQYDMLRKRIITLTEFFEENDNSEKGYLYYLTRKKGKKIIQCSSKLTEIVDNSIGLKDE